MNNNNRRASDGDDGRFANNRGDDGSEAACVDVSATPPSRRTTRAAAAEDPELAAAVAAGNALADVHNAQQPEQQFVEDDEELDDGESESADEDEGDMPQQTSRRQPRRRRGGASRRITATEPFGVMTVADLATGASSRASFTTARNHWNRFLQDPWLAHQLQNDGLGKHFVGKTYETMDKRRVSFKILNLFATYLYFVKKIPCYETAQRYLSAISTRIHYDVMHSGNSMKKPDTRRIRAGLLKLYVEKAAKESREVRCFCSQLLETTDFQTELTADSIFLNSGLPAPSHFDGRGFALSPDVVCLVS